MRPPFPWLPAGWLLAACASPPTAVPPPPVVVDAGVDLRPRFAAFGLDPRGQGPRPTCSVFTTVSALEYAAAQACGRGERFSVEYLNWAANAATGRADDGDFFHFALAGYETFGICRDALLPYGATFDPGLVPPPAALVDGGRHLADVGRRLCIRWLRPNDGRRGLSAVEFDDLLRALRGGTPVAVGAAHSRLLVGFRADPAAAGGGAFLTLDSGLGGFGEIAAEQVRTETCDAFVVEPRPAAGIPGAPR